MVHLVLSSTKGLLILLLLSSAHSLAGNQGLKYFPYVGYLGLTPVRVEGVVRTKVDTYAKQLLAKSITVSVRCYESRIGRVSVLHSNVLVDYTQVLWSKPDGEEYASIDELEFPFRITVPARVGGFSTSIFVDYRCMWRVEAVLNHVPITAVGSRQVKHFELPLVRFDVPWSPPYPPCPAKPLLLHQTTKPKAPRIRYYIDAPTFPIGPLDIVSIPIHLMPLDHSVTIRSATVTIERRIQLNEIYASPEIDLLSSSLPIPSSASRVSPGSSSSSKESTPSSSYYETSPTAFSGLETVSSDGSSDPTVTPSLYQSSTSFASDRPLLVHAPPAVPITSSSSSPLPSKLVLASITASESTGQFIRNDQGVWTKTVTLQWPAAKSQSRWAIGETIQSELVSVRFFARVKVSVSSPNGTDSIELSEKELLIVSTNEVERKDAVFKYNELLLNQERSGRSRSKSKSPRRSRREMDSNLPQPPAPFERASEQNCTVKGSIYGSSSSNNTRPRRPHTSAGPRDNRLFDFAGAQERLAYRHVDSSKDDEVENGFRRRREDNPSAGFKKMPSRPETSQGLSSKRRSGMGMGNLFSSAPKMSTASSGSSNGSNVSRNALSTSNSGLEAGPTDMMREWEQELAKIEMRSRKSSDLLWGFVRKRSVGAPKTQGRPTC